MAGEIVIRFTGDASGLKNFYQGVGAQTDQFVNRLTRSYQAQFRDILGLSTKSIPRIDPKTLNPITDKLGRQLFKNVGSDVGKMRFEFDQLNDVIKVTAQTGLKLSNGKFLPTGESTIIRGSVKALTDLSKAMDDVYQKRDRQNQRLSGAKQAILREAAAEIDPLRASQSAAGARKAAAKFARDSLDSQLAARKAYAAGLARPLSGAAATAFNTRTNKLLADRVTAQKELNNASSQYTSIGKRLATIEGGYATQLQRTTDIAAKFNSLRRQELSGLSSQRNSILADKNVATPQGYQAISRTSQGLLNNLTKSGLGTTGQALYDQKASFAAPVRDLVTGVTHLSGAFNDNKGVMQRWHAEIDKNGKLVTRFGGNLSGMSRITEQISRNFQKVIEWTVATTVVFGALTAATQGLEVIKNLDANLTRLSVTANLSAEETKNLYGELVKVADVTATPLQDLVKAADDFALAVKRPGQSTEQLISDIRTLSQVVGIYTNLTGEDTVTATDELVAIMKQLGYTASGVYGILNKVTAAAGGQSGAISDITKGLSAMAEAGKQANLTVNQQIGVIKTLSQVTSKSPAEIATSFKNLVGALSNPAALKALKSYNIGLISEGNNIIDIYSQIADKIRTGAIKENDISGLLRAISGGPRRSPDAAALLANINQVLRETAVAAGATNEAFLANAQIVDTIQAKFIRLQNILQDQVFTQFGQVFKDAADAGLTAATQLVELFSKIPSNTISTVAAIAGILLAFKALQKVTAFIGTTAIQSFRGMALSITGATKNAKELAIALELVRQETIKNGKLAGLKGAGQLFGGSAIGRGVKAGAIGAVAGAGLSALSGGGQNQIIGGGLQGLGLGLLTIPEPTLITKVAGGIALLAGTFVSLQQSADDSKDSLEENAQGILNAYQAAGEASAALKQLKADQVTVEKSIQGLESKGDSKTAEETAALVDLYKQYGDNVVAVVNAQIQLNDAIDAFSKLTAELPGAENFGERLKLATQGDRNDPEIQKIINQAQASYLQATFPDIQQSLEDVRRFNITPKDIPITAQGYTAEGEGTFSKNNEVSFRNPLDNQSGQQLYPNISATLDDLKNGTVDIRSLFKDLGDGTVQFNAQMNLTGEGIDVVNKQLAALPDDTQQKYQRAFDVFKDGASTIDSAATALKYFQSQATFLRATGFDAAATQIENLNAASAAIQNAGTTNVSKEDQVASLQRIVDLQTKIASSKKVEPDKTFRQVAEDIAKSQGALDGLTAGSEKYNAVVDSTLKLIFQIAPALNQATDATNGLNEAAQEALAAINDALDDVLGDVADKSAELFASFLRGDINSKQYAKAASDLNKMATAAKSAKNGVKQLSSTQADFDLLTDSIHKLGAGLSTLPGLQDAATLSADQLIGRIFSLADSYGLNGKQLDKLRGKINDFFRAIAIVSKYRTSLGTFYANVDVSGLIAAYQALNKGVPVVNAYTGFVTGYTGGGSYNSIIKALKNAQNVISGGGGIPQLLRSGSGNPVGTVPTGSGGSGSKKTPKQGPGKDVSTLDLPEEIADAPNRAALIREAIRRARALQGKIPGETKEAKNDIVELLKGTQRILEVRGVKDEYLRKALEELAEVEKKRLEQETKADTIRRIRVGDGSFAAIANVPVNSKTGISLGGAEGPINITLNLNGTVLTPAQFDAFANMIGASIKRQLSK